MRATGELKSLPETRTDPVSPMKRREVICGAGGAALAATSARAGATQDPLTGVTPWSKSQATALCIGLSNYDDQAKLRTPRSDAVAVARQLNSLGFTAKTLLDPTFEEVLQALAAFRLLSEQAELTFIFVAGHGVQIGDTLNVVALDALHDGKIIADRLVPESTLLQATSEKPRQRLLLLDSCRTPPVTLPVECVRSQVNPHLGQAGVWINYAAQPNAPAFDGAGGHSPFTAALLRVLKTPDLDLDVAARRMRLDVIAQTKGLQVPWLRSSLLLPLSFAGKVTLHGGESTETARVKT